MSHDTLDIIRTRRVIRKLTEQPVEHEQLETILDAGRWAPSGGNQRIHRFVVVQESLTLRLLRMVSPGMYQRPQAVILICNDWDKVEFFRLSSKDRTFYIDVGTAMQNMLLAAHAIGLGAGPVTSFSKAAVRVVLNLPQHLTPEVFVCLGHPAPKEKRPTRVPSKQKLVWQDLTDWERF
jgi:nitroreductase